MSQRPLLFSTSIHQMLRRNTPSHHSLHQHYVFIIYIFKPSGRTIVRSLKNPNLVIEFSLIEILKPKLTMKKNLLLVITAFAVQAIFAQKIINTEVSESVGFSAERL